MPERNGIQNKVKEVAFGGSSSNSSTHTEPRPRIWVEINDLCGSEKMMFFLIAYISSKKSSGSS